MKEQTKEIINLSAKEVLLSIFDLALPFFEANNHYRIVAHKYKDSRGQERSNFKERIRYLKKSGMITSFIEGKEKYLELTPKGLHRINTLQLDNLMVNRPNKWDSKWRVVIFDIPEKHKEARNILRKRLIKLGFEKVQESVYVYPFECAEIIASITRSILQEGNILIMISEIIQGEESLINKFISNGILSDSDIKK